ncbi:MAG: RNA polymerase sigma factor [Labedaea sp.]
MTTERLGEPLDRELWDTAVSGDGAAFGRLFDRHARNVYNHCFRLTASWTAAEDHTQSTFLLAWRKRARVRLQHDSALPWLLAVATNVVRNEQRARLRRSRLAVRFPVEQPVPDHADDVAGRIDDQRRMTQVLAAAGRLPKAQREALALCVWADVSYADAAAVLGIAESSVRARVSKARARLGGLLNPVVTVMSGAREDR